MSGKPQPGQEPAWYEPVTGFFGGLFGAEEEEQQRQPPKLKKDMPEIDGLEKVDQAAAIAKERGLDIDTPDLPSADMGDVALDMPDGKDFDAPDMPDVPSVPSFGRGGGGGGDDSKLIGNIILGLSFFCILCGILGCVLPIAGNDFVQIKMGDILSKKAVVSSAGQTIIPIFLILGIVFSAVVFAFAALTTLKPDLPVGGPLGALIGMIVAWLTWVFFFMSMLFYAVIDENTKEAVKLMGKEEFGVKYGAKHYIGFIFMIFAAAFSLGNAVLCVIWWRKVKAR